MRLFFSFLFVLPFLSLTHAASIASSLSDLKKQVIDGKIPCRGVNLGGWLVAERWMTGGSPAWTGVPDDIANEGEYCTMKYLGHEKGDKQFDEHRRTFITEQDFEEISAAGMNTVRITVGYWIVGFDHTWGPNINTWKMYAPGALAYLDTAIRQWAKNHNILVLISFHAAKGSQNGNDNSSPEALGETNWFAYEENVNNTLDAVEFLANRYKDDDAFLGIGLLNEPQGNATDIPVLQQYYEDAYVRIRTNVGSDCLLSISPMLWQQKPYDGNWASFMIESKYHNLRHEWHHYHVWGFGADKWTPDKIITWINSVETKYYDEWKGNPILVGEWSIASQFKMDNATLKRFANAQINMFKKAIGGWTYWAWRYYDNSGVEWSMKHMIQRGMLQW
uniref:glucan 1,3-beta-glucosidase n=1 Tax=Panagrolaimus davidi TaxID=227884 RepID=A0A914PLX3_9BILA